jgi:glycosidase
LDVPGEIDDDAFWEEFRSVVKSENPDAYLVGEIWDGDPRWVGNTHFDGLMNYPVREGIIDLLMGSMSSEDFSKKINKQLTQYKQENVYAMYNPLGSHDTVRIKTELKGDIKKLKLAYLFLMAFPGAPAIYYGDEIGLEGGKDPACRKAFPWDEKKWDDDLRRFIRQLITIRKNHQELRRGSYQEVLVDSKRNGYCFARNLGDKVFLMVMNTSDAKRKYRVPVADLGWKDGRILHDLLSERETIVSGTELNISVDPWQGMWLV